jgi:hypothetical protein
LDEKAVGWGGKYVEHNGDLFYVTEPTTKYEISFAEEQPPTSGSGNYWVDSNGVIYRDVIIDGGASEAWVTDDEYFAAGVKQEITEYLNVLNKVGFCYRWEYQDPTNKTAPVDSNWILVKDTEVTKALADAARAQGTADGKATIFSAKPQIAYQYGDLIIPVTAFQHGTGSNKKTYSVGKIYRCKTEGEHASFNNSHWEEVKYTDDTLAISLDNQIKNF